MLELQELCGEASPLLENLLGTLVVASTPPPMELSHGDKVNEAIGLAPNSEALFAKELCDLLVRLEAAIPGSSKEIACLLEKKTYGGKIQKVKEYLRSKCKKSGAIRRKSADT
jgi:hypothetical protein